MGARFNAINDPTGALARQERIVNQALALEQQDRAARGQLMDRLFGYMSGSGASGTGAGLNAEGRLAMLLDNPEALKQTAAYKFRVGQGQEALQRSLGARGLLGSGNRLTELTKYGQDMASQEYENQFGRLSNLLGMQNQLKSSMFGSLAGGAGNMVGNTGSIWNAYSAPAVAGIQGGYEQNRPKQWRRMGLNLIYD